MAFNLIAHEDLVVSFAALGVMLPDRKALAGHCGAMYPKCKSRLTIERGGKIIFIKGNDKTLDRRAEDDIRRSLMEGEDCWNMGRSWSYIVGGCYTEQCVSCIPSSFYDTYQDSVATMQMHVAQRICP